jgi:hypothetical protein
MPASLTAALTPEPCIAAITDCIDWQRPWLRHLAGFNPSQTGHCASVADFLNQLGSAPVRFVPQSALTQGQAYEQFIFATGSVPTRENLHDFFNGLCWLAFPHTKKKLNQLQAAEIAASGVQNLRGPVRDALTVLDENAAFLSAPAPLWEALEARDWQRLFVQLRPLWAQAKLVLFGHALLEKLVSPRKAITAHVYRLPLAFGDVSEWGVSEWDECVAQSLSADCLKSKPFLPLPVLGVPLWWPENDDFSFYDDALVFRPRR